MDKRLMPFALGDVFEIYSPKKRFNANAVQFGGKYPYVARGSSNNGIRGYITEDVQYLSPAKSLSFGQDTATVFYQPDAYFTGDKIKVMVLRNHELNDELAQYFITVITKAFSTFAWGQSSFNEKILKATKIVLPVIKSPDPNHEYTVDDIDFEYMQERIAELEQERIAELEQKRIAELDAYLAASGLDDYELTDEDKEILSLSPESASDEAGASEADFGNGQIVFKTFKVSDVFNKVEAKCKKADFDKRRDASTVPNEEYCVPLVNAKVGDNGIMFYGRKSDWNTQEMCIDVIQNGAVATGTVYAQPQAVGVLWDAYLIKPMVEAKSVEALLYMAKCIEKITKEQFSYDKKATWDRVKLCEVSLPVTLNGDIDFDYMERYIRAIEKLAIADVAKYKDKLIAATKQVVGM